MSSARRQEPAPRATTPPSLTSVRLETPRLVLRSPVRGDAEPIYVLARDRTIHPFLMLPFPYRREHARGLIPSARRESRSGVSYSAVIQRATDGVTLGMASLVKIHPVHRRAEIGYWLGRPHWGQGYGREALGAVIRFAFLRLKLRKVYAHTIVGNARSERLLQACGLRCEGLLRSEVKTKGRWRDLKRWGLLREDAARRRRKT